MEAIKIEVTGNIAKVIEKPLRITSGTVGLPVEFVFDSHWDNMTKVAVFNTGIVTKNMKIVGNSTVVPIEALAVPELNLSIGVYGVSADGSVATPTVWASVGQIRHGAVPGSSFGSDIGTAKKYYDLGEQAAEKADASAKKAESDASVAENAADRADAFAKSAADSAAHAGEEAEYAIIECTQQKNAAINARLYAEEAAERAEAAADRAESAGGGSGNAKPKDVIVTAEFEAAFPDESTGAMVANGTSDLTALEIATAIRGGATVKLIDNDNIVYEYDGYRLEPSNTMARFKAEVPTEEGIKVYRVNIDNELYAGRVETLIAYGGGSAESEEDITTSEAQEGAALGEELVTANGWTTDGWTGDLANGFTHTSGNTNPLIYKMPVATDGKLFQISFNTSVAPTTTNLFVRVGNSDLFNLYGQADPINVGVLAVEDGNLEFIPASNFTGTLTDISVKEIVGDYSGNYAIHDSRGNEAFMVRTTKASTSDSQNGENNLFMGALSGRMNTSGYGNLGVGNGAMQGNTSGFWNVGLGYRAMENNTAGSRNIAIGYVSLLKNEVGNRNIAIGTHTLRERTTGDYNIAIGADSQLGGAAGSSNVSIGHGTMYHVNNGSYNVALGEGAMSSTQAGGSNCNNNIAIGHDCMMPVTGSDNVAIGRNAGYKLTSGIDNVFIGVGAAKNAGGAKRSLVIGASSGQGITTGSDLNVIIGNYTGNHITTGVQNIIIGANLNDSAKYSSYWLRIGKLLEGYMYPSDASLRYLIVSGGLELPVIPTSDPKIANRVWNDNGTLKVSAG